jgi:hypothetical protein
MGKNCFASLPACYMDNKNYENYLLRIGFLAVKINNRIVFKIVKACPVIGCLEGHRSRECDLL